LFVFKTREVHTDPLNTEVVNFRETKIFHLNIIILRISRYAKHIDATADTQ